MNLEKNQLLGSIMDKISKFSQNKYLIALRDGMVITVPFTILGSIFLIINNLPLSNWSEIISPYSAMLNSMVNVTFNMLSLIVVLGISYQMAHLNKNDVVSGMAITVISFVLIMNNDRFEIDFSNFGSGGCSQL